MGSRRYTALLINEPMAAAIAYGLNKKGGESQTIIYDLGGGMFDVSLLSIDDGVFEVLATTGDTHLGGEDFDNRVIDYLIKEYKKKMGTDASSNMCAMGKLKHEVEKAKCTLSSQQSTCIEIKSFEDGNDFLETLTRAKSFLSVVQRIFPRFNKRSKTTLAKNLPTVLTLMRLSPRAAVQGGILSGEQGTEDVILIDICPLTLSIKTTSGVFTKLIPRNTVIPMCKSWTFSTVADNQPPVLIHLELSGIPLAPRSIPQIEIMFKIDAHGIMKVAAADKGTGKSESITITNEKGRLSKEDIECMVREAEDFASEDEVNPKCIKALNSLSSFVYGLKSQLGDQSGLGGKLSDGDKKTLLSTIKEAMEWIEDNGQTASTDDLEEKLAEIQSIVSPGALERARTVECARYAASLLMEPIHANSAPKADVQMSVSESLKKGIPLLMATVLHLLTFKLKPVNAKWRRQSKSKMQEQEADIQDMQTGVPQAYDVPSMDPILELEDETDDIDVLPDRLKGAADFLTALSGGNDGDEMDESGDSSNEDFDMDVSLSDTDGDEESEDDDIELVQFLQQKHHPKPTVSQVPIQQKWWPGRPKMKPTPMAEPAKVGATSIETDTEFSIFKAKMQTLIMPQRLTNGKISTQPLKNCLVYFEDGDAEDASGNGNKSGTTTSRTAPSNKQKATVSPSGQLEGSSHCEEFIKQLQQRWQCETHMKGPHSPIYCYSPSGGSVCYPLTINKLSFWALEMMEGNATVDEKPVMLSFNAKEVRPDSRSTTMAPPLEMGVPVHSGQHGRYGTQIQVVIPPQWGAPGYQGGTGQIYPSNQPSENFPHNVLPSTSHPSIRAADDPDIVKWCSFLDCHKERNKDGITYLTFGPILKQKGFFRLSQLMSSWVRPEALQSC
ncbi:hypothetical protein SCLCIDRAFT_30351 [Scleroderma citrinum Foug A]|uniref:Uncharacterized protein n=1 Tax=Scleroderma citrinum Foug A TaxID=1036808 RepID=A0A0C3DGK4_9AGAM|nr:hypothetical protein SCLCIDRAFT_30351 [Scleroderma citrinum Foug A]